MNNVILVDILDAVYFKIYCGNDQAMELKEFFTCFAVGYRHNPKYKAGSWDGKIRFFDKQEMTLPIGLLRYLKPFLKEYDYKVRFLFDIESLKNPIDKSDLSGFFDALFDSVTNNNGEPIYPRDYQEDAVLAALRHKRGVLESATGSGKSLIIYSIIRFILEDIDGKILLVVPSVSLVNQMYNDFKSYGWDDIYNDVSLLFSKSKKYDVNKKVLISTWQSIYKRGDQFFKPFGSVIVDETHGSKSASIQSVLKKCVNASYRLGLTGTLPSERVDVLNIFGYLGPKIYSLKSKTLIDRGYLSPITIVNMFLKYPINLAKKCVGMSYSEETDFISKISIRNKVLKYIVGNVKSSDNILILCQKLNQLDDITKYLSELYPERPLYVISGQVNADKREKIRQEIETKDGVLLVATYGTLSTGINIPKLHHVIFASFYKSKIKVLQSIGRGLRLHKSKKRVIIWDIIDDMRFMQDNGRIMYNYGYVHFKQRLKYYIEEGFDYKNRFKKLEEL